MPLIERVMGLEEPTSSGHRVTSAILEYVLGKYGAPRSQAANTAGFAVVGVQDSPAAQEELAAIFEYVSEPADNLMKMIRLHEVEAAFSLAQARRPGYETPAEVRAKLAAALS